MTISSKTGSSRIALNKKQFKKIFIAKYKTCRRILRKFANFHIEFAIIGDFSSYTSKPLISFMSVIKGTLFFCPIRTRCDR
ncbi:DUF4180 domain-containing protein [Peribacillus frigoritolerans]|uniref:DUF4180 domain-containing protein n=1 Tax=Peribacillus frigoritolerans TaxID=450367 RepID=UPI003D31E6AD